MQMQIIHSFGCLGTSCRVYSALCLWLFSKGSAACATVCMPLPLDVVLQPPRLYTPNPWFP